MAPGSISSPFTKLLIPFLDPFSLALYFHCQKDTDHKGLLTVASLLFQRMSPRVGHMATPP